MAEAICDPRSQLNAIILITGAIQEIEFLLPDRSQFPQWLLFHNRFHPSNKTLPSVRVPHDIR